MGFWKFRLNWNSTEDQVLGWVNCNSTGWNTMSRKICQWFGQIETGLLGSGTPQSATVYSGSKCNNNCLLLLASNYHGMPTYSSQDQAANAVYSWVELGIDPTTHEGQLPSQKQAIIYTTTKAGAKQAYACGVEPTSKQGDNASSSSDCCLLHQGPNTQNKSRGEGPNGKGPCWVTFKHWAQVFVSKTQGLQLACFIDFSCVVLNLSKPQSGI